jgi:hypothetical protein
MCIKLKRENKILICAKVSKIHLGEIFVKKKIYSKKIFLA